MYTDVSGINSLYHGYSPVRKIIHPLKLVYYLHVQADKPWYNYYMHVIPKRDCHCISAHALSLIILAKGETNSTELVDLGSCWMKRNRMHHTWVTEDG